MMSLSDDCSLCSEYERGAKMLQLMCFHQDWASSMEYSYGWFVDYHDSTYHWFYRSPTLLYRLHYGWSTQRISRIWLVDHEVHVGRAHRAAMRRLKQFSHW